jgi:hypothetical protein
MKLHIAKGNIMTWLKITKTVQKQAEALRHSGGAVPSGCWTTGSGRYTKKRVIPAFAQEYARGSSDMPATAKRCFNRNPRIKKCVAADSAVLRKIASGSKKIKI